MVGAAKIRTDDNNSRFFRLLGDVAVDWSPSSLESGSLREGGVRFHHHAWMPHAVRLAQAPSLSAQKTGAASSLPPGALDRGEPDRS